MHGGDQVQPVKHKKMKTSFKKMEENPLNAIRHEGGPKLKVYFTH